jgi:hypothetical protein
MSFADAGIGRLDVVGPSGLMHFLAAARSYTFRYLVRLILRNKPQTVKQRYIGSSSYRGSRGLVNSPDFGTGLLG